MTTIYARAVNAIDAVARGGGPTVRADLEALKALIDVMIAKLPLPGEKEIKHADEKSN